MNHDASYKKGGMLRAHLLQFVWELARYIAAEGMVIIPAIKERLENADEMMIAKDKEEHEGVHCPFTENTESSKTSNNHS